MSWANFQHLIQPVSNGNSACRCFLGKNLTRNSIFVYIIHDIIKMQPPVHLAQWGVHNFTEISQSNLAYI